MTFRPFVFSLISLLLYLLELTVIVKLSIYTFISVSYLLMYFDTFFCMLRTAVSYCTVDTSVTLSCTSLFLIISLVLNSASQKTNIAVWCFIWLITWYGLKEKRKSLSCHFDFWQMTYISIGIFFLTQSVSPFLLTDVDH